MKCWGVFFLGLSALLTCGLAWRLIQRSDFQSTAHSRVETSGLVAMLDEEGSGFRLPTAEEHETLIGQQARSTVARSEHEPQRREDGSLRLIAGEEHISFSVLVSGQSGTGLTFVCVDDPEEARRLVESSNAGSECKATVVQEVPHEP